jgi:hypothetical protein
MLLVDAAVELDGCDYGGREKKNEMGKSAPCPSKKGAKHITSRRYRSYHHPPQTTAHHPPPPPTATHPTCLAVLGGA